MGGCTEGMGCRWTGWCAVTVPWRNASVLSLRALNPTGSNDHTHQVSMKTLPTCQLAVSW
jgi:hypothetical protein